MYGTFRKPGTMETRVAVSETSSDSQSTSSQTQLDPQKCKQKKRRWRIRTFIVMGTSLVLAVGIALVIPLCMLNGCWSDDEYKATPTPTDPVPTTTTDGATPSPPETTTTTTTTEAPTPPPDYRERELRAETDSGPVVGHVVDVHYNPDDVQGQNTHSGVVSWIGIPFAKPPVGDLRWRKPEPVEPWTEPLIANKQTPLCIQGGSNVRITHPHWPDEMFQEDCLYMHIVSPRNAARNYPVMLWIYGGSFNSGGNVQYPGHFLAMHDVVVVTINYRVNVIGFASTESGDVRGNYGLWDQLEALKWVHKNIHAFGGNPNNITLFGESAGGASVGLLLASPEARGYFSQAIMQSGNEYSAWAVNGDEVDPHSYIVQVAEQWNCTPETSGGTVTDDDEMMDCLRKVDADDLRRTRIDCPFCLGFSPVVDGQGGILPKMPLDLRLERLSSEVPIMHGTNSEECTIGFVAEDPTLIWRGMNRSEFNWVMEEVLDHFEFAITEEDRRPHVRRAFNMWYTPWPFYNNGQENKVALANMCLDLGFVASAVDQLRHHSRFARSYKYVYSYQLSPTFPPIGWAPDWLGVPHAFELPLVFGFPFLADNPDVAAEAGDISLDIGIPLIFSPLDRAWSSYTMTLWTNFAKYGNPTPEPITPPHLPPVTWEEFNEMHHNYFLLSPDGTSTRENYRSHDVSFAHNYANGIARGADMHNPFGFPPYPPPPEDPVYRELTVDTKYGPVTGHPISTGGDNPKTIGSYLGIPFAKPPVGQLRWEKPQEPYHWVDPYIANTLKAQCIQTPLAVQITHPGWNQFSEDCLYLNVYTPLDNRREPYPVMVYYYGGAYQFGGTLQYPGHFLAAKDVVVVVVTYRTNILGFLSTDEPELHSNYGLWDQLQGLKWVNENIRNFGGDPDQVTIFGQSAGAGSVGLLTLSPHAEGLFHKAIFQSGGDLSGWAVNGPEIKPDTYVYYIAEEVGCGDEAAIGNEEMLDCMRQIPAEDIYAINVNCPACLGFGPVVDGPGGYLPKMPRELRTEGKFHHVPVMTGATTEECTIFMAGIDPTLVFRGINRTEFESILQLAAELLDFLIITEGRNEDIVNALNWFYSPWPEQNNGESNKRALAQICTDIAFVAPEHELIEYLVHRDIPVYQYKYSMTLHGAVEIPTPGPIPPVPVPIPEWIGSTHMFDLPFVWGWPLIIDAPQELQDDTGNLAIPLLRYDDLDKEWSEYIITLWTNFAKYGNPTPNGERPPNSEEHMVWNMNTVDERNYFYMDNDLTEPRVNLRTQESSFWNNYLNNMARGGPTHHPWQWDGESRFPLPSQDVEKREIDPKMGPARNFFNIDNLIKMFLDVARDAKGNEETATNQRKNDYSMRREQRNPMYRFSKEIDVDALKSIVAKFAADKLSKLQ